MNYVPGHSTSSKMHSDECKVCFLSYFRLCLSNLLSLLILTLNNVLDKENFTSDTIQMIANSLSIESNFINFC